MDVGTSEALAEALACFDQAIALRQGLPLAERPGLRWGLAAGWMNRADVLTRQGGGPQLRSALHSYDEAIQQLRQMPPEAHASHLSRLSLAWMNKDALAAIRLATEFERTELLAAQAGLQARHLLCRAVATLAETDPTALPEAEDWVTQTTDAVDEGMALTRHWRRLGEDRLEALALDLFRFGSLVYAVCQPHFLVEFLLDSLDSGASRGSQPMHETATHALWNAARRAQSHPDIAAREALLENLRQGERQILALRGQSGDRN
jgi:hypothetical protein